MARQDLNNEAIRPVVRIAWSDANSSAHAEAFLRSAAEQTTNIKVKGLACFSLARHQLQFSRVVQALKHSLRGKLIESRLGPEKRKRIRAVDPKSARREAEALFERTFTEYSDLRP